MLSEDPTLSPADPNSLIGSTLHDAMVSSSLLVPWMLRSLPDGLDTGTDLEIPTTNLVGRTSSYHQHHHQRHYLHQRNSIENSSVSDAGTFVLTETSLDMHCWGQNPVVTAKLQLNGQDRFSEREGTYFDQVQPYQAHTRHPDTGINVYSFALRPEEHQPTGTCNFSRIDNATLQLVLSNATVEGTKTAKVRVYATNYNVLRIMSGMGGLAYSN